MASCGREQHKRPVLDPDLVDHSIVEDTSRIENTDGITITVGITDSTTINEPIFDYAKTFIEKHPNVSFEFIRIKNYDVGNPYSFEGDYERSIIDMLDTGETLDMFVTPIFYVPSVSNMSRHLYDIYELIEDDETFYRDDYFMNVIDAHAADGKLYEFPLNFKHHYVAIGSHMPGSLIEEFTQKKTVDWFWLKNVYDLYGVYQGKEMSVYQNFFLGDAFVYTVPSFYEYIQGDGWLDDKKLVELFLEAFNEPEPMERWVSLSQQLPPAEKKLQEDYMFAKLPYDAWQYFYPIAEGKQGHGFINPLPYADENGRLVVLKDKHSICLSINKKSLNKEAAWEFIKHMTLPETNGIGEIVRNVPGIDNVFNNNPIYKPTYMAMHDNRMPRRMIMLTDRAYNIGYEGDMENWRLYIKDLQDEISNLTAFVLPYGIASDMAYHRIDIKNNTYYDKLFLTSIISLISYKDITLIYGKEDILPVWHIDEGIDFDIINWGSIYLDDEE